MADVRRVGRTAFGILMFVLLVSGTAVGQVKPDQTPQNVIVISWDGTDRSVIKELLEAGKLPNTAALIKDGSLQEITVKGHQTETMPGHAQMLTGLDPKITGVFSNEEHRPIPEGLTIFERMQVFLGGKDKIRTIMVTGKIAHLGGRGPGEVTGSRVIHPDPNGPPRREKVIEQTGEPFFLTKKSLDVFDAADRKAAVVTELFLKNLETFKGERFLAFAHFREPDSAGHAHTRDSSEYREAIITCDEWLGKIVEWLKKEGLYEKSLIYVTTDHGFDAKGNTHLNAPDAWLATNDKAVKHSGIQADIPATILTRFGVNIDKLEPKLIGKSLTGVSAPAERVPEPAMAR